MSVKLNIDEDIFNKAYLPALYGNQRFQIFYGGA